MSAQTTDINGFVEIKGNPISKVGVYPYLGREIGGAEPDKVYMVLRPEEELSSPDTIASFKLAPLTDEHAMLGDEAEGLTPAERKGVHGVIGENVYYEAPYLRGNLKLYSESAKGLVRSGVKRELSPGYRFRADWTPGIWDGKQYDAIQRDIRANHLALVEEGRTGPDVAVLDTAGHLCALDSQLLKEAVTMADESNAASSGAETLEAKLLELLPGILAKMKATEDEMKAQADAAEVVEDKDPPSDPAPMGADETAAAMDALRKQVADLTAKLATAQDSGAVIANIAARDELYAKVSRFIGAFDHASMTADKLAAYAVGKIGLQVAAGAERVALAAWLHGRTPDSKQPAFAADSAAKPVDLNTLWKETK
jgi:hypothetical protein